MQNPFRFILTLILITFIESYSFLRVLTTLCLVACDLMHKSAILRDEKGPYRKMGYFYLKFISIAMGDAMNDFMRCYWLKINDVIEKKSIGATCKMFLVKKKREFYTSSAKTEVTLDMKSAIG